MFGRDPENVKLEKALRAVGADPGLVRDWFKTLEKMRKIAPSVKNDYEQAHNSAEKLRRLLDKMEGALLGAGRVLSEQELQLLKDCRKSMRELQGKCDHNFVISPEDKEFHSTFDMLLVLQPGRESNAEKTLILQSEIENLQGMVNECLDREPPSLVWLCYYYANRQGKDLEKLAPAEKLAKVRRVYQNEFVERMRVCLTDCIQEAYRLRGASGRTDKNLEILFSKEPRNAAGGLMMAPTREAYEKQADEFMVTLCQL